MSAKFAHCEVSPLREALHAMKECTVTPPANSRFEKIHRSTHHPTPSAARGAGSKSARLSVQEAEGLAECQRLMKRIEGVTKAFERV